MSFNLLRVARPLQPWRTAGLHLWLCEDEAHALAVRHPAPTQTAQPVVSTSAPAPASMSASRPAPAPASMPASRPPSRPASAPASMPPSRSAPGPQPTQPLPADARPVPVNPTSQTAPRATQSSKPQTVRPVQDTTLAECIQPEAAWPEPWRALLAKSPQGAGGRRARIVWSYPALSDDYGGRANPARRAMLQQLLRDLALPSGSHGFWPQTPPPYATAPPEADPVFFHSGIEALNPLVVVLFGAPAPSLRLPTLVHLVPDMVLGRTFVRVQDVDTLAVPFAAGNPQAGHLPHQGLVQFLKSQLGALFIS